MNSAMKIIGKKRCLLSTRVSGILLVSLLFPVSLMLTGCAPQNSSETQSLTLKFEAFVGSQALAFNRIQYENPGGGGQYKVRDFQFIISNIKLLSETGIYVEADSYHIVRFDNADKSYTMVLDNIPLRDYQTIVLSIGVDPAANSSVQSIGDLDPNSRMAWSWDVGYKFILFEGGLSRDNILSPLVYHVGFNENYKVLPFSINQANSSQELAQLIFKVDIESVFASVNVVDMAALPSVKFDKDDARLIAENYATMITLKSTIQQ